MIRTVEGEREGYRRVAVGRVAYTSMKSSCQNGQDGNGHICPVVNAIYMRSA